jgi:cation diffusion facilitator CzcD-associated flavoprotein CzcO
MAIEYVDVIIVGAGLSGIGSAIHLTKEAPNKTYTIVEGRDAIGGTWDIFRYPGVRSDSDMFTLGYEFKPWTNHKGIADGDDICNYIREAADEYGVKKNVRFGHKVKSANFDSASSTWHVIVELKDGTLKEIRSQFFISCTGYYDYDEDYTPEFAGRDSFKGDIIEPQFWPENYDYSGKKVVVIGSGATAVTLVPAMTDKAKHVTMLQRSPSYVISVPQQDIMVKALRKLLPEKIAYRLIRGRNISITLGIYQFCLRFPKLARKLLQWGVKVQLPKGYDMSHFTPKYNPWNQRLCAVPLGDMFKSLKKGTSSVVTDHIDRFVENGILLKSGQVLEADMIVTATGLKIQMLGKIKASLDGVPINPHDSMSYRGAMMENVPNFAMVFGYTNSSWTLKSDLIGNYVARLLKHMDDKGVRQVTPRNHKADIKKQPFINNMSSGYIQRVIDQIPQQGDSNPWLVWHNYFVDMGLFKLANLDDPALEFSNPIETTQAAAV